MRGIPSDTQDRGVSEIYGSVLIISMAFIMAILLIGVGSYVVSEMQTDTEEQLTQDSMQIMDERIASVTGAAGGGTSEFMFPEGAGDIEATPDAGTVEVTVRPSNFDIDYLAATDPEYTAEFTLGEIRHDGADDVITTWQGGGLFQQEHGVTTVMTRPQFDYDGTTLSLRFTNLTRAGNIFPGQEVTVRGDEEAGLAFSQEIHEAMEKFWTVHPNDHLGAVGTDQVDVEVRIESSLADGWAEYAREGMTTPPDGIDESDTEVILQFEELGEEFDETLQSHPNDFPDNVVYAGNSSYALFNTALEPEGDGFTIDHSEAEQHIDPAGTESDVDEDDWLIAVFDNVHNEFVVTRTGSENPNEWFTRDSQTGSDNLRDLQAIHGQVDGQERLDHILHQIGGEDAIQTQSGETPVLELDHPEPVCIFGEGNDPDSFEYPDVFDWCSDLHGADAPVSLVEGADFEIESWEITPDGEETISDGDTVSAEVTITNVGDTNATHDIFLKGNNSRVLDWHEGLHLHPGEESAEFTLEWDVDAELAYYEYGSAVDISIETPHDNRPTVTDDHILEIDYDPGPGAQAEFAIADFRVAEYPHEGQTDAVNPDSDDDWVDFEVDVDNIGEDSGEATIALSYYDEAADTHRTVAVESETIQADGSDTIEIQWNGVNDDGNILDTDETSTIISVTASVGDDEETIQEVYVDRNAT